MSSFAGMVSLGGAPIPRRFVEAVSGLSFRGAPSRRGYMRQTPHAVFIQSHFFSALPNGAQFASSSRLDNGADIGVNSCHDEAECIRHIFEARSDAGIAQLLGVFAFAHWDERTATLTLARDCVGGRSLFYHVGDGFVAFASSLSTLLALPQVPRELDERMLANFLALNHHERETTFYRGVARVPSRTVVRVSAAGVEQKFYWSPDLDKPPPFARDEDYVARARELFDRAVARTLRDTPRAAIMLSGGFDSSALAATAARLGHSNVTCYTGVPPSDLDRAARPGWYPDERPKVEALAKLHPSLRTVFVTPRGAHSRQSDPTRYFPALPIARRNLSDMGWLEQIYEAMAADGFDVFLNGGIGNMTISWDGTLSLAALLRQGRLPQLLAEANAVARTTDRPLPRVLANEAMMPLLPASVIRAIGRLRGQVVEDVSKNSLLRPEIIDELDLRLEWREQGFDPTYRVTGTSAKWRARFIFDHRQHSSDVRAMRFDTGDFEVRDPYTDRELIEFCLTVPEDLYRRNGVKRWFARQVFADRLPPEILSENRRGEQATNWFESLDERKPLVVAEVERLEASPLASRLIDLPRLKRLIAQWPKDAHAAQARKNDYRYGIDRAVHVGQFIRWVEGGNG